MSKGLEALERIINHLEYIEEDYKKYAGIDLDTIEKELKEKEKFEELVNMDLDLFMKAVDIKGLIEDYQNFKKALEIIKKYALQFDWTWLFNCIINNATYKVYICGCTATDDINFADKDEYYFLKEVLL